MAPTTHPGPTWRRLQADFRQSRGSIGPFDLHAGTLVVLPSLTLAYDELRHVLGIQHYEERLLFVILLLKRPAVRIVYLSSEPIDRDVIDYYLSQVPGQADARHRLLILSCHDRRQQSLTSKVIENSSVIAQIRDVLAGGRDSYLLPFNVTTAEEGLAETLGIPMYGPRAQDAPHGDKSNGRRVARAAGVPVVEGVEDLHDLDGVLSAFRELRLPAGERAVLKLNDSFSGMGNVILSDRSSAGAVPVGRGRCWAVLPDDADPWDDYARRLGYRGGVLERMVPSPLRAPSVQILIPGSGRPHVISTHDQILGGVGDQVYLGCSFPADERYRHEIVAQALSVAEELARRGVIGVVGVDFLVSLRDGQHQVYFGEINLRLGGTTHPFGMCKLLTEATYDDASGLLVSRTGPVFYVASDNVAHDRLVGRSPASVMKDLTSREILFDHRRGVGVTLHQLGSIAESGKLGLCALARSMTEAQTRFDEAVAALTS